MDPAAPPIRVGLVGAGPWAEKCYVPMLTGNSETRLAGVWARRDEAARAIAGPYGAEVAASFEALIDRCDAVAFAVPPDVQAELAPRAARASKHLLLDKPLALELDHARRLADAVAEAGVVSQLMLTQRFRPRVIEFLERARTFVAIGGRLAFLSGAFVEGRYATPWRREHGALFDLGPHALDLVEAALGPVVEIRGAGDPRGWVGLVCTHEGGAVSDIALSGVMRLPQSIFRVDLYGPNGALELDAVAVAKAETEAGWPAARRSFVDAVRTGVPPAIDVRHGLRLQTLIDRATRSLT
jgi:predicted dehydrogenase